MLDLFDTGWDWVGPGKFTVPGLGLGKFLENGNWNGVLGYCTGPGLIVRLFDSDLCDFQSCSAVWECETYSGR